MTEVLDRITHTPDVMGGKACIRGMRVTVGMIIGELAGGNTTEGLLREYPYLEKEDITQALRFAALLAGSERELAYSA